MLRIHNLVEKGLRCSKASSPPCGVAPARPNLINVAQPSDAVARIGRIVLASFFLLIFGFGVVLLAAQQEHSEASEPLERQRASDSREREQVPDLDTDNLDLVSASAAQIREVLDKDPGLMMELKRLMAKQATDRGQIVSEQDLEDGAILDRLDTDTHFRALATRLLQRYGYLTPQVNPKSFQGKEQDLFLRARAERLARGVPDVVPASGRPSSACRPGQDSQACSMETSETVKGQRYEPETESPQGEPSGTGCDPQENDISDKTQLRKLPLLPKDSESCPIAGSRMTRTGHRAPRSPKWTSCSA